MFHYSEIQGRVNEGRAGIEREDKREQEIER
jgi:hypothetical protein